MMQREGLSFSDYFDDSVPYEVKPVPCLTPMQEVESPIQFPMDRKIRDSWLDKDGRLYEVEDCHYDTGRDYLRKHGIPIGDDVYTRMYELGFIRLMTAGKRLYISYDKIPPTNAQNKVIKDYCIMNHLELYDDNRDVLVDLSESLNEGDIPVQSKDLFKGLWEDTLHKNREYWLDPQGMIHRAIYGHEAWAEEYLNEHGISYNQMDAYSEDEEDPGCYYQLFVRNFVRLFVDSSDNTLYATYRIYPNTVQMRKLKDSAIESQLELMVGRKYIDLTESKYVNKDGRSLFIESMMPDNMDVFKSHLVQLFAYLQKELQLKTVPSVKLISDEKNADKVLGKTAYYNPDEKLVVLYTTNRHQKDILRSFAHEIIHHWQHENEKLHEGDDKKGGTGDPQYAQNNPWLRQMEKQAYLLGNMLFRDWEDQKKAEDKKSGNDGKGGRVNKKVKEQHGKGNVRFDSLTPIMKQKYSSSHPYRQHTEGPQDGELDDVKETTYSLGNEYPPKKMDYRG